jgi:hypothetical protein
MSTALMSGPEHAKGVRVADELLDGGVTAGTGCGHVLSHVDRAGDLSRRRLAPGVNVVTAASCAVTVASWSTARTFRKACESPGELAPSFRHRRRDMGSTPHQPAAYRPQSTW